MNYAEELTYWFYRLNGYFIIRNFVIHNVPENRHNSGSDVDILAIRFPFVAEQVGGQEDDWHETVENFINEDTISALIIEVKSGAYKADNLFQREDIVYVTPRFGCFSEITNDDIDNIYANANYLMEHVNVRVSKVLAAENVIQDERFNTISMNDIRAFIRERLNNYIEQKYQSRFFFPSELLQHLINEENIKNNERGDAVPE